MEAERALDGVATPHIDESITASSVGNAVIVSRDASEAASWIVTEETLLPLLVLHGPVGEVLVPSRVKLARTFLLIEGKVEDDIRATLVSVECFSTLSVEDGDVVVVTPVGGGDELGVAGDGASGNCPGVLCELRPEPLLAGLSVPHEDCRPLANLASDGPLSAAVRVHIHGHDIVGVMVQIIGHLLGFVLDFATTKELLGVRLLVQDDSEASSHVDDFAFWVIVHVLPRVLTPIPIHVLKTVARVWLTLVDSRMILGFFNCTKPGLDRQELLTSCYFRDLLIEVEEIICRSVCVDLVRDDLISLLVDRHAACILEAFWLGTPGAFCGCNFS